MPTYEYECDKCGYVFERFQNMSDERIKRCPKCRGKVRRLLGAGAGIIFKGSGFYATDHRSNSYEAAAKRDKTAASAVSTGTSDSKTDTKKKSKKSDS